LSSGSPTVLVADGDPELLEVMRKALRSEGFSVSTAADGFEAVTRAFDGQPDAIVCGYLLPGMSGPKVCRFLRSYAEFEGVPIALLTPRADRSDELRARWAGADRLVTLPLGPSELTALCRDMIENGSRAEPVPAPPPDRYSILSWLSDVLEQRVHHLEAVRELAADLRDSVSVLETFRRIASGVLTGLGFERVCVMRYDDATGMLITEAVQGRRLSQSPGTMSLDGVEGYPATMAISEKRQVRSTEFDSSSVKLAWAGSADYVDTPLIAGDRVVGLLRCDNAVTGRAIGPEDLLALSHYADYAAAAVFNSMGIEEISESRTRMTTVLAGLESGLILVDRDGRILEATDRLKELFGKPPDSLRGRSLSEALPLLTTPDRKEMLARVLDEGRSSVEHGVVRNRSGIQDMILNVRYVPFRRGGHITGAVIIVDDVTEESRLRENLRKRSVELETISRAAREFNSTHDVDEICRNLNRTLVQFYPDEYIAILLPERLEEGSTPERMAVMCTSGYPSRHDPIGSRIEIERPMALDGKGSADQTAGVVVSCVRSERFVNITDTSQDSRYVVNLPGVRSELAVPMVIEERGVVGVIDLQSRTVERFTSDSIRRVTTLANHAATAVDNALLHSQILEMAQRDRLTGLRNLRFFESRLSEEQARARRYDYPYSLIMIDIDDFKHYNDNFGHPMGNVLLQQVAGAIEAALREVDILVRYGGEEFVVILPLTSDNEAAEIAERIRKKVLEASGNIPHSTEQPRGCVSVSLGVSTYLADAGGADELLELADNRMYMAKRAGKNRVYAPALGNC
jgi:diguanylate cyclase (GGDEF)-like protein/PAS domain S-box-containing protein